MIERCYLKKVLKDVFGLKEFRPGQLQVVEQILSGRDVFVIMPTGAGKSLCFQLPAFLLDGITVVVSPLISLMNDQVIKLKKTKISAVFLNRSITSGQVKKFMNDTIKGLYKLVYIAPERLDSHIFFEFVKRVKISLVVIDEAHCVLQWGFGFRPSYLKIANFFNSLDSRPIFAAFTATATCNNAIEIQKCLSLKDPFVLSSSFERQNLFFDVFIVKSDFKIKVLLKIFKDIKNRSTIVYCQTRKNVELVYLILKKKGFKVVKYHAGLSHEIRRRNQAKFLIDEASVLVATNSFGMGIDKKNVRNVVHFNMPKSLEDYYQESGRAGRDGGFARCLMIFSESDVEINRFLIEKAVCFDNFSKDCVLRFKNCNFVKLEQIKTYCKSSSCYRNQILNYFGEKPEEENCFNCGNCHRNFIDLGEVAVLIFRAIFDSGYCLNRVVVVKILKGRWFLNKELKSNRAFGVAKRFDSLTINVCIEELILQDYLIENKSKVELKLLTKALNLLKNGGEFKFWIERKKLKKGFSNWKKR